MRARVCVKGGEREGREGGSPLIVQGAARVPGCGGRGGPDPLVVVLHLQPDGPAEAPGDVEQPLHYQLPLLLQDTQE